MIAVTNTILQD